jgi:hypothetical protein
MLMPFPRRRRDNFNAEKAKNTPLPVCAKGEGRTGKGEEFNQ